MAFTSTDIPYNASASFYNTNTYRNSSPAGGGESLFQTLGIGNDVGNLPITASGANPFQVNAGIGGAYFNMPTGSFIAITSGATYNCNAGFVVNDSAGSPNLNIDCSVNAQHYFHGNSLAGCKLGINNVNPLKQLDVVGDGSFTGRVDVYGLLKAGSPTIASDASNFQCELTEFSDDAAALVGGLKKGDFYQTSGGGAGVLAQAGLVMIVQ